MSAPTILHLDSLQNSISNTNFLNHHPVLIDNAVNHWPALDRWGMEYLKTTCGKNEVYVCERLPNQGFFFNKKQVLKRKKMSFKAFIEAIESNQAHSLYLTQANIPRDLPELYQDIRALDFISGKHVLPPHFWMGPGEHTTPLHYDYYHNVIAQIRGEKIIDLYAPCNFSLLTPYPFYWPAHHISRTDVDTTSRVLQKHKKATVLQLTLTPGQALYIPPFWWHRVKGQGINQTVNYWWLPRWSENLKYPRYTIRKLAFDILNRFFIRARNG